MQQNAEGKREWGSEAEEEGSRRRWKEEPAELEAVRPANPAHTGYDALAYEHVDPTMHQAQEASGDTLPMRQPCRALLVLQGPVHPGQRVDSHALATVPADVDPPAGQLREQSCDAHLVGSGFARGVWLGAWRRRHVSRGGMVAPYPQHTPKPTSGK